RTYKEPATTGRLQDGKKGARARAALVQCIRPGQTPPKELAARQPSRVLPDCSRMADISRRSGSNSSPDLRASNLDWIAVTTRCLRQPLESTQSPWAWGPQPL